MIIIEDYSHFKYTKIEVPIKLEQCPSDHEDSKHFLDVACDMLHQRNCYIGSNFVEELQVTRLKKSPGLDNATASEWLFTIILPEVKDETTVSTLLDELCSILSLQYAKRYPIFQNHGLRGFSYRYIEVKRSYALSDRIFGDRDLNHFGGLSMISQSGLPQDIFHLPSEPKRQSQLSIDLENSFLTAMKSTDPVARYILLYYLFEIMFKTQEYHNTRKDIKKQRARNRSLILCAYLKDQFNLETYSSFDKVLLLTPDILEEIILTRDALAHNADTSKVSRMMYYHMLPILQQVVQTA